MNLSQKQIDFINDNEWLIIATADMSGQPRACVVIPSRVEAGRLILSDVQMGKTNKNIQSNPKIFISSYDKGMNKALKLTGIAEYIAAGALFDEIRAFEATRNVDVKAIITVSINGAEETSEN